MKFGQSEYLYLLWLLPLLVGFYVYAYKKRTRLLSCFAASDLVQRLISEVSLKRKRFKTVLLVLGVISLILAAAGPKYGFRWQEIKRRGIDIVIAIDTSKSMLSEDVKPNRLERAKFAVKELLPLLEGDRIGLVAFAGTAFTQCPLTLDYSAFVLSLDRIDTDIIPRGGTAISRAISAALKAFPTKEKKHKALILITDGEDHEGDPIKMAQVADKQGLKIYTVGIGTTSGELIPITDEQGNKIYLKDQSGRVVKTRLDAQTLRTIALKTKGAYVRATNTEFGLDKIYSQKIAKMEKKELQSKLQKRYEERYSLPLLFALGFILLEMLISERRKQQ